MIKDPKLKKDVDDFIKRAKEENNDFKPSRRPIRGSLAEIIKTPEQARRLMLQLELARLGIYV